MDELQSLIDAPIFDVAGKGRSLGTPMQTELKPIFDPLFESYKSIKYITTFTQKQQLKIHFFTVEIPPVPPNDEKSGKKTELVMLKETQFVHPVCVLDEYEWGVLNFYAFSKSALEQLGKLAHIRQSISKTSELLKQKKTPDLQRSTPDFDMEN